MKRHALGLLVLAGTMAIDPMLDANAAIEPSSNVDDRLTALEQELQDVHTQLADLKRSQSDQYGDVSRQFTSLVQVRLDNGRPTFTSADNNFSAAIRTLVQFDW